MMPTQIEEERRLRIKVSVWAYAYEIMNDPIATDQQFDEECAKVNIFLNTGRHDDWFRSNFDPWTGMWVRNHPDLAGLHRIYLMHKVKFRRIYGADQYVVCESFLPPNTTSIIVYNMHRKNGKRCVKSSRRVIL